MATRKRSGPTIPDGYEPAKGFPNPLESPRMNAIQAMITHMPHSNGTVCGRSERNAAAYTLEQPTCPTCRKYYDAVQRTAPRPPAPPAAAPAG